MRFRSQDGATAVVVVVSLIMLAGVGALAVDLGSVWSAKRDYSGGADAAAIAAARSLYRGDCTPADQASAADLAVDIMQQNVATDVTLGANFLVEYGARCGDTTVKYTGPATVTFAGIFGVDELAAYAETTVATMDFVGGGLRPLSVCMGDGTQSPDLGPGEDLYDLEEGDTLIIHLDNQFDNNGTDVPCSPASGNFGWTCFDVDAPKSENGCAGSADAKDLEGMVKSGYKGEVDLDTPVADDNYDCQGDEAPPADCDMGTGAGASLKDEFERLRNDGTVFPIVGLDTYTCDKVNCNGSNATIRPVAFISVHVVAVDMTGSPKTLTLEVSNLFDEGTSSLATEGSLERTPPVPCDVEDTFSSAGTCPA